MLTPVTQQRDKLMRQEGQSGRSQGRGAGEGVAVILNESPTPIHMLGMSHVTALGGHEGGGLCGPDFLAGRCGLGGRLGAPRLQWGGEGCRGWGWGAQLWGTGCLLGALRAACECVSLGHSSVPSFVSPLIPRCRQGPGRVSPPEHGHLERA